MSDNTVQVHSAAELRHEMREELRRLKAEKDALTAMVERLVASGEDLRAHLNVAAWPASAQVQVVLDEAAAAQSEARALIGEPSP